MWRLPAVLLAVLLALLAFGSASAAPPCDAGHRACPTPAPTDGFWPSPDVAFPTVSDADTKNGTVTSNSTSWTLTYPTNIATGDLLLGFVAIDGNATGTWPAGWVSANNNQAAVSLAMAAKDAIGTETGTFTLTVSAGEQGGWRIFRIPAAGWWGTLGSDFLTNAVGVENEGGGTGLSANPDGGQLNPAWGAADTLWFSVMGADTSRTVSVFPASYTNTSSDVSGGAGGATLGVARITSAAVSENPGAYTISASDDWVVYTVAVRPAAVIATVPYSTPMPPLLAQ